MSIEVAKAPGISDQELKRRVRAVLPASVDVRTGKEQAAKQSADNREGFSFLTTILLAFGFIALFVGAFIIFNTFSITVAQRTREFAMLRTLGASRRQILSSVLKIGFARVRPDLVPHSVDVYTASVPSGHAMLSAVTYLTLGAILASVEPQRRRRLYVLGTAVFLTLLIGTSRVYLGVHWPTDVLAGWCIGSAWAVLCWTASVLVQRRFAPGPAERLPVDGVSGR